MIVHDFASVEEEIKLLFATEAYGMGAYAPDVWRVIHFVPPGSFESSFMLEANNCIDFWEKQNKHPFWHTRTQVDIKNYKIF